MRLTGNNQRHGSMKIAQIKCMMLLKHRLQSSQWSLIITISIIPKDFFTQYTNFSVAKNKSKYMMDILIINIQTFFTITASS